MKKLITTLALTATASIAWAQGTVNFSNGSTTQFQTNGVGVAAVGGPYYYELLTAPSTVTTVDASLQQLLTSTWSDTGLEATNTAGNGRINGGAGLQAGNWPGGAQQAYIVVGWQAIEGTTWAQVAFNLAGATNNGTAWSGGHLVAGGYLAASQLGNAESGGGPSALGTWSLFGTGASLQGTPISTPTQFLPVGGAVVPEPGTFALAGLGAAAMLIFRRRK